jgi:Fic family protein
VRIPQTPPDAFKIINDLDKELFPKVIQLRPTDSKGRYLHWEELRYRKPPEGLSHEQWWAGISFSRARSAKAISLRDKEGANFTYTPFEGIEEILHWLDINTAGRISTEEPLIDSSLKDTYLIKSLVDEAISSSQLEGASTTRHIAKEMIRQGRKPTDESETMIVNNYLAMIFIRDVKSENLTPEMIRELHRILTKDTLAAGESGKYRKADDDVYVVNAQDEIVHTPPPAKELDKRIDSLCAFANEESVEGFINPVIRAIILHFILAYDHPFVDGNGRTARALFYWLMAKAGYWLIEYTSISATIKRAPVKYGRAYLFTETDNSDMTYFICHQLDVIKNSVLEVQQKLEARFHDIQQARELITKSERFRNRLNSRQLALLRHALRHPEFTYYIKEHQNSHGIVYETARRDLVRMTELGLLNMGKQGKAFTFTVPQDLPQILGDDLSE